MRALVFHGPWDMTVEDRPEPVPGPGDALLEILATGICGSDLHGYTGDTGRRHPGQVMGHETVGRVLADASGTYRPGTLVTVNPVLGCRACPACAAGAPQRCPQRRVIGVQPDISAAFAERMVAPVHNVVPLPDGPPSGAASPGAASAGGVPAGGGSMVDVGCLVEPLAVGWHAVQRGGLTGDDILYVLGGGPIGQAVALAARRSGASSIVVAELDATRRDLLCRLGFTTVDPAAQPADAVTRILGGPPTMVVDAVGASATLAAALDIAALGARIVLVGMAAPSVEIAAYAVSTGERSIIGSFSYDEAAFRDTADWAGEHTAELEPLIERHVHLDEAPDTFRSLAEGHLAAGKILVHPALVHPDPAHPDLVHQPASQEMT